MKEFDLLYAKYKVLVFNLALHYVQNMQDAEEIAQDVFVKIYQNLTQFRHESTAQTWVYRITVNQCLDFLKAKRRQKRFAFFTSIFTRRDGGANTGHELPDLADTLSDNWHHGIELEQQESLQIIFACLNELPDKQKTALILHKIEQIPQREIAEIMQLSPKAVESLVQRAKINLQKKLKAGEGSY